jgi:hypothetical protein
VAHARTEHYLPSLVHQSTTTTINHQSQQNNTSNTHSTALLSKMPQRGRRGRGGAPSARSKRGKNQASIHPQDVELVQSDSSTSGSTQDRSATGKDITPIVLHGQKYYKSEDLAKKSNTRKKTSHIWGKGFEITPENDSSSKYYYCCLCIDVNQDPTYKPLSVNGISSIHAHFLTKHELDKEGNKVGRGPRGGSTRVKLLLIKWIVFCHIAFIQIENRYFRNLLNSLNSALGKFLPSRNTFRDWVLAEYHKRKRKLRKELRSSRSNIHLSFDLWTSPNCYAMIAIVAHFIDSKGYRQTKLLAIRQLKGEHSGENIAASVRKVIKEYRIDDRVGFFVLDNAGSNDTAVEHILCSLYPEMSNEARKRRRLRCLLHVTNLVAKAFLLGRKAEDIADELYQAQYHADFKKMSRVWHKFGALGRLHNLIRHIRLSPQRRQEFKQCQSDKEGWKEFNRLQV